MKKQLIVMAGLTAMFAACTNEDALENFGTNEVAKTNGITFSIVDGVESRGDFKMDEATKKFMANWNAEVDKINVAYYGAWKGDVADNTLIGDVVSTWNGTENAVRGESTTSVNLGASAVYKATKTAARGEFTSLDEENLLTFTTTVDEDGNEIPRLASFRAYRGTDAGIDYSTDEDGVETMALEVEVADEQEQTSATKAPFDNFVMVSDPIEEICNLDYAVGESLPLSFERAFSGLVISTTGYDKGVYGELKSVTVSMAESAIAGKVTLNIADKDENGKWAYTGTPAKKKIVLNVGGVDGLIWSDDYHAFIQILPVDRSEYRASELYNVTLTFANGEITIEKSSTKNWEANNFYTINVDLNATGNYLLSNNKLVVIKAMPTVGTNKDITEAEAAAVTEIVANVALSADDLKVLKEKFVALAKVTLANDAASLGKNLGNITLAADAEVTLTKATTAPVITENEKLIELNCLEATTIPAEAYAGNRTITNFNFPKVQTIGDKAFKGTSVTAIGVGKYTENLLIGTYDDDNDVKTSALTTIGANAFESCDLTSIDAPAFTTFGTTPFGTGSAALAITRVLLPSYDWTGDTMATLQLLVNNTDLQEIDLSGTTSLSGVITLSGKTALTSVILAPNTEVGGSAFSGAGTTGFDIVNLNKVKSVGESAFAGSALEGDIKFENTVAEIGKSAFAGTGITSFDFTGVTTIGESAFTGTDLAMVTVPSVEVIEKNVFSECSSIVALQLDAATTLKTGSLTNVTGNIVLKKAVTLEGNPFGVETEDEDNMDEENPYIITVNANLYVNASQEGVKDNTLTWKSGDYYYKAKFTKIVK